MIFCTRELDIPNRRHMVVLFFYRATMPFYGKLLLMLSSLEKKYPLLSCYAIDVDHFPGLCKRFAVENVPQLLVFVEEKEVKRLVQTVRTREFARVFADIYTYDQNLLRRDHV